MDLEGKAAIVTGSSSGIGRDIALRLAGRGCGVVINFLESHSDAEQTAEQARQLGADVVVVQADVSTLVGCQALVSAAQRRWERLDYLVNNAATTVFVPLPNLDEMDESSWDRIFAVNVKGPFLLARSAAELLRQARGAIVNVSSTAGINSVGSSIAYAASKAALNNLTVSLARALAPQVRVNAVAPGFVETRWLERGFGDRLASIRRRVGSQTPLGDIVQPADVSQVVLSLLTSMDQVTGQVLVVDGGFLQGG